MQILVMGNLDGEGRAEVHIVPPFVGTSLDRIYIQAATSDNANFVPLEVAPGQVIINGDLAGLAAAGSAGSAGPTGPEGPAGPAGPAGNDGAVGPMGLQGPAGANGVDGAVGPMGPQGPQGAQGANGADGAQGPTGPQGPTGADGAAGGQGPQGDPGLPGTNGTNGTNGVSGYERVSGTASADTESARTVFADCPAGKKVVGGGVLFSALSNNASGTALVISSYPSDDDTWTVTTVSTSGSILSNDSYVAQAFGICVTAN